MSEYSRTDLTGSDFRGVDLSGELLAHSTISGCRFGRCVGTNFVYAKGTGIDFHGADITGATFERADATVLSCLIGARWNGREITHVSGWITRHAEDADRFGYWSFATNAFVTIGCMTRPLAEWEAIGQDLDTLRVLHEEQPKIDLAMTLAWWKANRDAIVRTVQSFQSGE